MLRSKAYFVMQYDVIVIGGGIVGMATALQLLQRRPATKLLVLEKENRLAMHQSSHNSGVIHSGIYYKPGGLKARNCLYGYGLLVRFCEQYGIPFEICGKIIVATTPSELSQLRILFERGLQHGLKPKKLGKEQLKEYEPNVEGLAGLFIPQTGIVDFKAVALTYRDLIVRNGGSVAVGKKVLAIRKQQGGCSVITKEETFTAKQVVSCCGLYADRMAGMTASSRLPFKIIPFRGEYYMLNEDKKALVKNLIYPVPDPKFPFLGMHFTRTVTGHVEVGPNAVFAFKREGYRRGDVHFSELIESLMWPGFQKLIFKYGRTGFREIYRSCSKRAFTRELQRLIPAIQPDDIYPAGSGVRAQACSKSGELIDDFLILEDAYAVHVCNAPSPAATSSLAIGETVATLVEKRLG